MTERRKLSVPRETSRKSVASLELLKKDETGQFIELEKRFKFDIRWACDLHFEGITACDINQDNLLDIVVVDFLTGSHFAKISILLMAATDFRTSSLSIKDG